jgi:hypothetical protein
VQLGEASRDLPEGNVDRAGQVHTRVHRRIARVDEGHLALYQELRDFGGAERSLGAR